MSTTLATVVATLVVFSLVIIGLSIRVIFVKDGAFKGGCASNNPMLKDELGECQLCGAKPDEQCKGDEDAHTDGQLPKIA